ncbi:MAG TPA: endolytic transglycosylase MltG [Anaeromyxobacter sp.]
MKRALVMVVLLALLVAAAAAGVVWRQVTLFRDTPYGALDEKVVVVPAGASARAVVRALAQAGALSDEHDAWRYVRWVKRDRRPLRAGEYAFSGPLRPDEVLERVYRGEVRLHRFTVPEGLRADEIAAIIARSGLAAEADFLSAAHDPALARSLGLPYPGLEGFLFPDTYAFARGVSARAIAEEMVERFKEEYAKANELRRPAVVFTMGEAATFASIVEKETGRPEERPRIACVFHNRLRLRMRLQTDPTVMYATMLRTGRWSKNISRADLLAPHPYNTYTSGGLPPGPIANAGAAALRAALSPSECSDLYFVSRNDGTHIFCPDLQCHNAAVRQWQIEFFRRVR